MAPLLLLSLITVSLSIAKVSGGGFDSLYNNRWGAEHQSVSADGNSLTIWLDKNSGSGFKSKASYRNGYFGVSMKLQGGYTAGVIASFYLSNNEAYPGNHDEVDIEFLGTIPGKPYVLQTNVYVKGSGDGNMVGREMRFNLWFDPTASFHHYAISWNADHILFFVDNVPIRQYRRVSDATFPSDKPMWVYGSIWDASSWATDGGLYKADYRYAPFVARYTDFQIRGSPAVGGGLSPQQAASMRWTQSKYMIYDYCSNPSRDHARTPECGA